MAANEQPGVLFVVNTLATGGMERMTVTLAEAMVRRGRRRPVIACLRQPGELAGQVRSLGIELHANVLRHKLDIGAIRRLRRIMRSANVAAAVIVNPGGDRMFWTSLACGRRGRVGRPALILWAHSTPQPGRRLIEQANRPFIKRLDAVAVLGPRQAEAYARIERLPAERIHQVPNGLSGDALAELSDRGGRERIRAGLGASADDVVVLSVANLRPVKRIDLLCRAAARVLAAAANGPAKVRFWLAGDGAGRHELEDLGDHLRLRPPDFVWLGRRPDADRLWPAADIGVCCSDSEGMSVSMLSAMAAGCAFVSTAVGGHPTVIQGEQDAETSCGLLVRPGSADDLAAAITRLADDPSLRLRLGERARRMVRERYTADRMAEAFESMLQSVSQLSP